MRYFILFIFLLAAVACSKDEVPKDVLSKSQMTAAIRSVYLNEQSVSRLGLKWDSAQVALEIMQHRSFEKLGIADSVFKKSLYYYSEHTDVLDEIYGAVIDSLNFMEQRTIVAQ